MELEELDGKCLFFVVDDESGYSGTASSHSVPEVVIASVATGSRFMQLGAWNQK